MDLFLFYVLLIMGIFALYPISMTGFKELVKDILLSIAFLIAAIIRGVKKLKGKK